MSDLEEIRRVIVLYGSLLDDGRFDEWGQLYAEDAEWIAVPGINRPNNGSSEPVTIRGRENIVAQNRRLVESSRQGGKACSLHFSGQPIIDVKGVGANAWWDFILMRIEQSAMVASHAGRYYARLEKQDGRWRFSQRVSIHQGGAVLPGLAPIPGT